MKVEVKESNKSKERFPMLMSCPMDKDTQIILATGITENGEYAGTNVNGIGWPIGYNSLRWSSEFRPWHGEVILSNHKE